MIPDTVLCCRDCGTPMVARKGNYLKLAGLPYSPDLYKSLAPENISEEVEVLLCPKCGHSITVE